jgi:toxin ParE1/3/4
MANFRLTPEANKDIINIRGVTQKRWGQAQSKKYIAQLRYTIKKLAETPAMGKRSPDVVSNTLRFPCASHMIYYTTVAKQIVVFAILHKRMEPANHLPERGLS